jgi:hypothetical protein
VPAFYQVKVVTNTGTPIATFDADEGDGDTRQKASVESVSWVLNEPGLARIRIPNEHPKADEMQAHREVQVWRDGAMIWWGVALQRSYARGALTWTCPGLLWYYTRLHLGPVMTNYLTNPLFATNLAGWTAVGCVASRVTSPPIRGAGVARLVAASSGDNRLEQTFLINTGSIGVFLTAAGWFWIDPAVAYTAPALDQRGLYIDAPNSLPDSTPRWSPITMNHAAGVKHRLETGTQLAPSLTNEPVTLRLMAPHAAIQWGALSVTAMESVSSLLTGSDIAEMMAAVVVYCETDPHKSSHNIGVSWTPSGVMETVAYQFYNLPNAFQVLKSYATRGLADFSLVLTPATRTFTTHAPRKGTLKAGYGVAVPGSSTTDFTHRLDGAQTTTRPIRRGAGEGSDREIGIAVDTSLTGGLVLEDVRDAPAEFDIDGLDKWAATDLARLANNITIPTFSVPAEAWMGGAGREVEEGDRVPVTVNLGAIQEATTNRRVMQMVLTGAKDEIAVTVNPEPA